MKLPFWPNPVGYRNISLGLARVYDLLDRIGNPHLKLPPAIHIAGTNGKGSTLSFLRSIFQEANYLVDCYTSPHLVSFNERIIIGNKNISDDFLNECLKICKDAALRTPEIPVTFFEGITVAAFLAFSQSKSNILLLETGLGGRLDATNVIKENLCSIITPISFDHTDFLGDTLAKIAFEKAGIIKNNCLVIVGKQEPEALAVIKSQAQKMISPQKIFGEDFFVKKISDNSWNYQHGNFNFVLPNPSLLGAHQIENAACAVTAALSQSMFVITEKHIKQALTKTIWPARLQKISQGKFYNLLPDNFDLMLDGSHNLQGAVTIKNFLQSVKNKKKILIFAMLQDKDCAGFLSELKNEIDEIFVLEIPNEPKSLSRNQICQITSTLEIKAQTADNFHDAFAKIISQNKDDSLIMVCGSLYLAGSFLEENL